MKDEELIERLRLALDAVDGPRQISLADVKLDRAAAEALPRLPGDVAALAAAVKELQQVLLGTSEKPDGLLHRTNRHAMFWRVFGAVIGSAGTAAIGYTVVQALGG